MRIFQSGIKVTRQELASLRHVTAEPEQWSLGQLSEKIDTCVNRFLNKWRGRLVADPDVSDIPANKELLITMVRERGDFTTTIQDIIADGGKVLDPLPSIARYASVTRDSEEDTTLFPDGIEISDTDANCMLDVEPSIEDWIYGALLGHINRGKKKMIAQYHPIILADPAVTTMPATEAGLIDMIVARDDYKAMQG